MFDNLKDIYNLRKQAQEMEKQAKAETAEGQSSNGLVRVVLNGKFDLLEVQISDQPTYDKRELAQSFKEAYASAQSAIQKILMQKFQSMI